MDINALVNKFKTWDEAFKALSPVVRQQSVRVASYTSVLFETAIQSNFSKDNRRYPDWISRKYTETAYKCGLYHQLGKAVFEEKYQIYSDSFSINEKKWYRLYPLTGRLLIANLQELSNNPDFVNKDGKEPKTDNIPSLMIRDAACSHMERYDGFGYPKNLRKNEISPIAQIVSLAKYLDFYSSENISEHPFNDALEEIYKQENNMFSSELIGLMKKAESKCFEIYNKYIPYTLTVNKTISLVDKRENRPLGLKYLPLFDIDKNIIAYKAIPYFKDINGVNDNVGIEEVKDRLVRTSSLFGAYNYLLYELTDCALRIKNCQFSFKLFIDLPNELYNNPKFILTYLLNIFALQNISVDDVIFGIDATYLFNANNTIKEKIHTLARNKVQLLLKNYQIEGMSLKDVQDFGFNYIHFDNKYDRMDVLSKLINDYKAIGISTYIDSINNQEDLDWYLKAGVSYITDYENDNMLDENYIIESNLKLRRAKMIY